MALFVLLSSSTRAERVSRISILSLLPRELTYVSPLLSQHFVQLHMSRHFGQSKPELWSSNRIFGYL